ncbi:hypothetical protein K438DRAFT_580170 [Mycena galopus ATCC 62051]|nr:hypothetical protein K438DRAFT_580170 [Mycena galopus ATCC 62051]
MLKYNPLLFSTLSAYANGQDLPASSTSSHCKLCFGASAASGSARLTPGYFWLFYLCGPTFTSDCGRPEALEPIDATARSDI